MKTFHEVAYVKEGNKTVGYPLREGRVVDSMAPIVYYDMSQFDEAVKRNEVQYFQWDGSKSVVKYTDEELKILKKAKFKPYVGKEYKDNDMHFRIKDVRFFLNGGVVFKIVAVHKIPLAGSVISVMAVGNPVYLQALVRKLNERRISTSRAGVNWITFSASLLVLQKTGLVEEIKQSFVVDTLELTKSRTLPVRVNKNEVAVKEVISTFL